MNNRQKLLSTLIIGAIASFNTAYAAEEETVELDNIIVTAKSNSTLDSIAATVNVITAEEIEKSGASNLQDILEQVPGFSFTANSSSTYGRKNIGLRGMDSQHILILMDGERTNATDGFIGHSDYQSSYFNINNIERIEIIKGAGSVLYGSEAIGGVINIITKSGSGQSYSSLSLNKGFATSRSEGDSTGISFGAGAGYNDFYGSFNFSHESQEYATGTSINFEEVKNRTIDMAVSYNFSPNTKIDFSLLDSKENRNLLSPYYDIDRNKYSLGLSTKLNGWSLVLKAYKMDSSAEAITHNLTHNIEDKVLSAEVQNAITNNQFITIGLEQHKTSYLKDYTSSASPDYRAPGTTQKSIYAQDKITFNDNTLTLGLRLDDNSQFGHGTSASIGYVHTLTNNLSIKASYGTAYKAPNIKEADSNYIFSHGYPGATVFQGNSNLDAETSRNAEIALVGKASNIDWSVAAYHTKIKDMIVSNNTGTSSPLTGGDLYLYDNIDNATVTGLELEFNIDLSDSLFLNTSLTKMHTDNGQGGDLSFRPKTMAKVKLSQEFNHNFLVSISANHTGKSSDGLNKVDSYTLYDAVLNKAVNDNVSLQLAFKNIGNEKLDDVSDNHMTELLGREVKASFNLTF